MPVLAGMSWLLKSPLKCHTNRSPMLPSNEPRESQAEEAPVRALAWNNWDVLDILVETVIWPSVALRFRTERGGTLLRRNTLCPRTKPNFFSTATLWRTWEHHLILSVDD